MCGFISCCVLGCNFVDSGYPYVQIHQEVMESRVVEIGVGDVYKLESYEKLNNDDGTCTVTINFDKRNNQ